MNDCLKDAIAKKDRETILAKVPYAQTIDMHYTGNAEHDYVLKQKESNIGNPTLPALHGGCIGGFMENTALVEVIVNLEPQTMPKIINFSLDYLKPGRFQDTFARCNIIRKGKKVVNVAITAWQDDINTPIAKARAHILL